MTADCALVVVGYRSHHLLETLLRPLAAGLPDVRCVVVDNFSDDAERTRVTALADLAGWTLVAAPNDGFGAGVNRGVHAARALGCTRVLLVNPDLSLPPDGARALLDAAADRVVAPTVLRPDGAVWFDGGSLDLGRGLAPGRGGTDWLSGACLAAPVAALDAVGGFAEEYFMYWEDVDLGYRLRRAGWPLAVLPEVTAVHDAGGTQEHAGSRRKSDLYYRYNCRGRLVFAARNLDRAARSRWVRTSPAFAREVVLRGGRRQLLRSLRPVVAAVRGTLEGVAVIATTPVGTR